MTGAEMNQHLEHGGRVIVATYTRATEYKPRHAGMFVDRADGVYVKRGQGFDYLGPADRLWVGVILA